MSLFYKFNKTCGIRQSYLKLKTFTQTPQHIFIQYDVQKIY